MSTRQVRSMPQMPRSASRALSARRMVEASSTARMERAPCRPAEAGCGRHWPASTALGVSEESRGSTPGPCASSWPGVGRCSAWSWCASTVGSTCESATATTATATAAQRDSGVTLRALCCCGAAGAGQAAEAASVLSGRPRRRTFQRSKPKVCATDSHTSQGMRCWPGGSTRMASLYMAALSRSCAARTARTRMPRGVARRHHPAGCEVRSGRLREGGQQGARTVASGAARSSSDTNVS